MSNDDKVTTNRKQMTESRILPRRIRIVSQILFFLLFTLNFFIINRHPVAVRFDSEWFLRLNPLVGIVTAIASRTVLVSLLIFTVIVALLTIVFGRFFCGFVCPLGAMIDFSDRFIFKKMQLFSRRPPQHLRKFKYVILIVLLTLSFFGLLLPLFMDPILLITRSFALLLHPAGLGVAQGTLRWFGDKAPSLPEARFIGSGSALLLLIFVLGGGFWDRRFWCQYICPSGALFGFLSRFALFRRVNNQHACNSCGACAKRVCPVRAIDPEVPSKTSTAECILCGLCIEDKRMCSTYQFGLPSPTSTDGPDLQRRHALLGIASGIVSVSVLGSDIRRGNRRSTILRPPSAIDEEHFLTQCLTCGQCMKVCPENIIQPSTFENGFFRLNTPQLDFRNGFCNPECVACGSVCPTGALLPVTSSEKPFTKTGTAVVNPSACRTWLGMSYCSTCSKMCPYDAILLMEVTIGNETFSVPVVDEDCCTGCGKCENLCPVRPVSAITVSAIRQRHSRPLVSDRKRKRIADRRKEISER